MREAKRYECADQSDRREHSSDDLNQGPHDA